MAKKPETTQPAAAQNDPAAALGAAATAPLASQSDKAKDDRPELDDYIVASPILYDGLVYAVGDQIELTDDEAATLLAAGAIADI